MNKLIFGFHCPICGEIHLLSALGVRPIVEDVDAEPWEPTLEMVEPVDEIHNDDGEVVGMSELRAVCCHCSGAFTIDLMVTPVTEDEAEPVKPHLTLVPNPDQSS